MMRWPSIYGLMFYISSLFFFPPTSFEIHSSTVLGLILFPECIVRQDVYSDDVFLKSKPKAQKKCMHEIIFTNILEEYSENKTQNFGQFGT